MCTRRFLCPLKAARGSFSLLRLSISKRNRQKIMSDLNNAGLSRVPGKVAYRHLLAERSPSPESTSVYYLTSQWVPPPIERFGDPERCLLILVKSRHPVWQRPREKNACGTVAGCLSAASRWVGAKPPPLVGGRARRGFLKSACNYLLNMCHHTVSLGVHYPLPLFVWQAVREEHRGALVMAKVGAQQ